MTKSQHSRVERMKNTKEDQIIRKKSKSGICNQSILRSNKLPGRRSFGLMKENSFFGTSHTSCLFTDSKMKPTNKDMNFIWQMNFSNLRELKQFTHEQFQKSLDQSDCLNRLCKKNVNIAFILSKPVSSLVISVTSVGFSCFNERYKQTYPTAIHGHLCQQQEAPFLKLII